MKDLTLKEDEIPTDETKANVWNAWVSQRDYGLGRAARYAVQTEMLYKFI